MHTHKISKPAWMTAPETVRLMEALHTKGGTARFAGGCVRDTLCNRTTSDIDIAIPLKPDDVMERLTAHKINYAPTGLKHGTITAIVDGKPFEITTLRIDMTTYGRYADVTFTDDWRKDAARRDFTINAMYADTDGTVYDFFDGTSDLRAGRVRFVGDAEQRIQEDVLRILRFFRFTAHYGKGDMDGSALDACTKHARLIPHLSAERIRHEVLRLLESDRCGMIWRSMLTSGIVTQFLPEAMNCDTLDRLILLEEKLHSQTFSLRRLSALLNITREDFDTASDQLRLSNTQKAQLKSMTFPPIPVSALMTESDARKAVYHVGNDMTRNLLLLAAAKETVKVDISSLYNLATNFRAPVFPLEGQDILDLGISSGPAVGDMLKSVEDWWIHKDFQPSRTECLQRIKMMTAG